MKKINSAYKFVGSFLFVSYHYPPEGGTGLPGVQRSVKFIRNFNNTTVHVLTIHPDSYPASVKRNFQISLPVNNESIHRTGVIDSFAILLRLRDGLKRLLGKKVVPYQAGSDNHSLVFASSEDSKQKNQKSFAQQIKDFIYDICYFPDQAGPWLLPAFWKGLSVIRKNDIKVIFATGMPWSGLIVGWLLHLMTRKPLIADFRDPWIGNPFHKSKGRVIDALSAFFEKLVVRGAALVTANTDPLRDDFLKRYPDLPDHHFMTLPNGFDITDFDLLNKDSASSANELVLCHAGFLYGLRDPAPILDAIRAVNAKNEEKDQKIVFKQVGRFDLHYNLKERFADLLQSGELLLMPECPYQDCLEHLGKADILVNVQSGTKTQVPSKLYDYLALNKPILNLTPIDGALGQMVERYGFGALFDDSDVDAIQDYLVEMSVCKKSGCLSADYAHRELFDIRTISAVLEDKINQIAGNA